MGYLYLNFNDNLESGSKNRDDFYATSLMQQYESIRKKLGLSSTVSFQEFISTAFPTLKSKYYYFSMPSFDRRMKTNRRGEDCVHNVVIRPERDQYLSSIVPPNYDLIVIGDITFGKVIAVTIKGIELIDSKVAKFGERKLFCEAAIALTTKSVISNGKNVEVPNYGVSDVYSAVLTNDFVVSLANDLYPVPHPERPIKIFGEWKKYIEFRKYYLDKQSEKCKELTGVQVCNSFMITREEYRRNEEKLSEYILDEVEQFARGEQVILSREVSGAISFPLIRVEIAKNRKEILSETYGKLGKGKPRYEADLQRYTRDSMGLSNIPPVYDENGNLKSLKTSYLLGERYLFAHVDVEPDMTQLENQCEADCAEAYARINEKYEAIIKNDLNKYMAEQSEYIRRRFESQLAQYRKERSDALEGDIADGKDYEAEIAKMLAPYEAKWKEERSKNLEGLEKLKKSRINRQKRKKFGNKFSIRSRTNKQGKEKSTRNSI